MNVADRARHLVTWLVSNVYSRTFHRSIRIYAHVQNLDQQNALEFIS